MGRTVLVDGYNVIRRDPALARLERTSLQLARDTLLACLNASIPFRRDEITVVFDGANSREAGVTSSRAFRRGHIRVIFSPPGESADAVIARLGAAAPTGTLVITDDREIRGAIAGAGHASANLAPRAVARPPGHHPPPRASGTWVKDDDLAPPRLAPKKGNGRRAPRKRNRPPGDLHW